MATSFFKSFIHKNISNFIIFFNTLASHTLYNQNIEKK